MAAEKPPRYTAQVSPDTTYQAAKAAAVVPSNTEELPYWTTALYVGGAGTVNVVLRDDTDAVSFTVPAGAILPLYVKQVKSTGTSATNIVALY